MAGDEINQAERDAFLHEHLPMFESEWPGSTLAHHVLKAAMDDPSDTFRVQLADALVGQRAAVFEGDVDHLGLVIESACIILGDPELGDCVMVRYSELDEEYMLRPQTDGDLPSDVVHSFLIPRH